MKHPKILIVEDEAWLAHQQRSLLEKEGYKVEVSPHARGAIQYIDQFDPDIIILDVLLPGATAFSLLHELQSYGDTGSIPVIICSSMATELRPADLEAYGVRKVLDKTTMQPRDIVGAVKSLL